MVMFSFVMVKRLVLVSAVLLVFPIWFVALNLKKCVPMRVELKVMLKVSFWKLLVLS